MQKTKERTVQSNPVARFFADNLGILLALLTLCIVLTVTTESFFSDKNILTVLRQTCINSLLAFGMTCVLIIGGIDLTVGSVVGASGVAVVMLMEAGVPMGAAIVIALAFGGIIGAINGAIIAFTGMPAFIVTLSMQGAIRGLAYIITDGRSVGSNVATFTSLGNGYYLGIPNPIYVTVFAMLVILVVLNKTKFGRRMYAIGGNATAAKFTGIKIKGLTVWVYVISAVLSSLAGIILASRLYSGQPTAGIGYESDAIAAAVLGGTSFTGGIGTIGGTLIGALVIGVLSNGLNLLHISSYVQMIIKGMVIIMAVGFDLLKNRNNGE